jgi:hypothetical protein
MLTALSDGDKRTIYHAGLLETHGATRSVVNKQST